MINTDVLAPLEGASKTGVEDTRLRILAAARLLYGNKGSRGTTTREVADCASVNEATLFRHFRTKQQLIAAMLDHFSANIDFLAPLERLRDVTGLEAQLRVLAFGCIDSMRRNEDIMRVSMAEEFANPDGSTCAWRAPAQARRQLAQFFAEKIAAGEVRGEPDWLARVFLSLLFAFVIARKIWADLNLPAERAVEHLVDTFLSGARPR